MQKHLAVLLGTLAGLAFPATALAVTATDPLQGITASPPIQRLSLIAGGTYSGSVDISNPGRTSYNFTVSSAPFSVKGEEYDLQYAARPDLVDASRWFSFSQSRYHLNPGQTVPVQFSVRVPTDAAGGGYYAVVFAQADPLPGNQGIAGQKRVGVLTYLTVGGHIIRSGQMLGLSAPLIQTQPPLESAVRLQNTGNVHYDARTSVQVRDLFGNVKAELEATDTIFPKTTRRINFEWAKSPPFGLYHIGGTVAYLDRTENLPARWTLMLSANAFLIIAGVLVAMGVFAFLTRRRRANVRRG